MFCFAGYLALDTLHACKQLHPYAIYDYMCIALRLGLLSSERSTPVTKMSTVLFEKPQGSLIVQHLVEKVHICIYIQNILN